MSTKFTRTAYTSTSNRVVVNDIVSDACLDVLGRGYYLESRPAKGRRKVRVTVTVETINEACKCSLRTKLVGDGCAVCNPKLAEELSGQSGI